MCFGSKIANLQPETTMERVRKATLNAVLTGTDGHLQRRLPVEEFKVLGALIERMLRRWPAQDMQDSIGEYTTDLEQLAIREGLPRVVEAVEALRISPGQKFFPRPDEVADEIDRQRSKRQASASVRRAQAFSRELAGWREQHERERAEDARQ
jgi:hypothetical protein